MKNYISILLAFTFLACSSKKENSIPEKLDSVYIQNATEFAKAQFECCKTQNYIPITKDIADDWLVKNLTIDVIKNTCAEINEKYGDLTELKIEQTLLYKNNYIYRFKAKYSKMNEYSEIRVNSDLKHKFTGLIFKTIWLDKFTKFKPKKDDKNS